MGGYPGQGGGGGRRGGGFGKLLLPIIIIAAIFLFGGGSLSGLLGGGGNTNSSSGNSHSGSSSSTGSSASSGTNAGSSSGNSSYGTSTSQGSSSDIGSLLASLLGSGLNQSVSGTYTTPASVSNSAGLDTSVASGTRDKFTRLLGNNKDTVTLMVYMCGTDLESKGGMASADLSEMAKAKLSDKVNILVYTGGCTGWKVNGISSKVNQIYQVQDGRLKCLVNDDGNKCMTDPDTLTSFIKWCAAKYPASRNQLIFWDHGGGSASGYGYDQKFPSRGSMGLAQIQSAIRKSGVAFDFIGFDACLMATVENAYALSDYADYLIASEETEPGIGWYYTDWLTDLSANTSMPTIEVGKEIIDDFIDTSARRCRGQSTTLSIVDLAEFSSTVPDKFTEFAINTNDLISANQSSKIYTARDNTREFAPSSHICQYDLIHLAQNLGTTEAKALAKVLRSSIKYNRTSSNMSGSYGLSVYFPGRNASRTTSSMVNTYKELGMDSEYTKCIQKLAGTQQAAYSISGDSHSPYGALTGNISQSNGGDLYGSLFGSGSGALLGQMVEALLTGGRMAGLDTTGSELISESGLSPEEITANLDGNLFDPSVLVWKDPEKNPSISLSKEQWALVQSVEMNMFFDDGEGYVDLGLDNTYDLSDDGVIRPFADGAWISINDQPVAYYHLFTTVDEEAKTFTTVGRVPCMLNGTRTNLIIVFDQDNRDGYVAGASTDYIDGETDTLPKNVTEIVDGDKIDFLCDYYSYDETYENSYYLGKTMTIKGDPVISYTYVGGKALISLRFTDLYNQDYWTPSITVITE